MRHKLARALVVPTGAWLAATVTVLATAAARGYAPFDPSTWKRWDSGLYIWIAQDGYAVSQCPTGWCGNAGWFPGYPWAIRAAHAVGPSWVAAGVVISWAAGLGALVLIWNTFLGRRHTAASIGAVLFAAFAPGAVYEYAVFPLALLACFTVGFLWFLYRGRWLAAGVAGAAATFTYPTAVALIAVALAWALVERRTAIQSLLAGALSACGLGLVLYDLHHDTGRWNAYFLVQRKYHHHLHSPLAAFQHGVAHPATAIGAQSLLVTVALACVLVSLVLRRPRVERAELLVAVWTLATWLLANIESGVSIYRAEATLLPAAILVRRLPVPVVYGLVALAAGVLVWMTGLFLNLTLL